MGRRSCQTLGIAHVVEWNGVREAGLERGGKGEYVRAKA